METEKYFENLHKDVEKIYGVMNEARSKGFDPVNSVESPLARTMAEKCVALIATMYPQMRGCGIDERILELEREFGKLDPTVVFKICEEVSKQKFCKFEDVLESIDAAARLGMAYYTIGVVASPLEGYTHMKIEKTREGKEYLKAFFSGPIRSAGTTGSCIALMILDFLRELFGYAKYDPSEEEINRYVTEITNYHERISNLQYFPTDEEIKYLAKRLPIQIAGEPTAQLEVSNYKNLDRVETNFIRGGMCLIFSEGLAQKAAKGFRLYNRAKSNGVNMSGFDWLDGYVELHESAGKKKGGDSDTRPTYIRDLVAGRPVYGHPSRSGSFRFRYGRGRTSGFSAASVHPATMAITDDFIAIGTQLKIEKPTKGIALTSCDTIDGPIVKLRNGSVRKLEDEKEAKKLYKDVEEIIYLGDMLFPFSDIVNRNSSLLKPGYVEEWWWLQLKEKSKAEAKKIKNNYREISFNEAIDLSKKFRIPLHSNFIFYWTEISSEQFMWLLEWLKCSWYDGKLIFPYTKKDKENFEIGKRALELLGVEHEVTVENVVLSSENSKALLFNLGFSSDIFEKSEKVLLKDFWREEFSNFSEEKILDFVNSLCSIKIKDKSGDFIGARMGRPEKAKLRKLTGSPNVLFPVGNEGGRLRSLIDAYNIGYVKSEFPIKKCEKCGNETIYSFCEKCGEESKQLYYYQFSKEISEEKEKGETQGSSSSFKSLPIKDYFDSAVERLGLTRDQIPALIKGIRGMSSDSKIPERIEKGILRAKYDLQVNKDGTIRMDATELPITHFKPKEVRVSVEKLKEMGYNKDIYGKELANGEQILELMPHDLLLPSSSESPDEKGEDVFLKICNFVDDELMKIYGMDKFYNVNDKEDLIGKLCVFMAPHNVAGVIGRVVGFSNTQGLLASPYMHAAVRRDCDGDEAAVMLLGDVLLNFSRRFLPGHRGGTQDAPLVLNAKIDAGEVDDQILDFEFVDGNYPLELYLLAEKRKHSREASCVKLCSDILREGKDPFTNIGFTHDTFDISKGVVCSSYKTLPTMKDKVEHQMALVEKIRAADEADTARLIIDRHFIRDMRGNLRKFSMQGFRCVGCNEIMRRPPLNGVCPKCGGKIIFTIHEGGIKKYLEPALELANKYNLSPYMKQNLGLIKEYIDSIFGKEKEIQVGLGEFT